MTLNDFQAACTRTWGSGGSDPLQNAALGVTAESGEFANEIRKVRYQGHQLNEEKAIAELGDVIFYAAMAARVLGHTLDEVAQANIKKLKERYPDGFDPERSKNRNG